MKRAMLILIMMSAMVMSVEAIGYRQAVREARFLTDKMAFELGLSAREYDRVYRANLDYLLSVNRYADMYSRNWHTRNSALQIVLSGKRWNMFIGTDYFYRPVSYRRGTVVYNVYDRYPRHRKGMYYDEPRKYKGHKKNYGHWKKHYKHNAHKHWRKWKD